MSCLFLFLFLFLFCLSIHQFTATGQQQPLYTYCDKNVTALSTTFKSNLNSLFSSLNSNATNSTGFHYSSSGAAGSDSVYGLFLCRGDQTSAACRNCVSNATTDLPQNCPRSKEAVAWYDPCMIRYSNIAFYGTEAESPSISMWNTGNVTHNVTGFNQVLANSMNGLSGTVAAGDKSGKKFGTAAVTLNSFQNIYVAEQCTPDLNAGDCSKCLENVIVQLPNITYGKPGARVLTPSCNIRYETYLFYNQNNTPGAPLLAGATVTPPSSPVAVNGTAASRGGEGKQQTKKRKRWPHIYAFVVSLAVTGVLLIFGIWICKSRRKAKETYNMNINEIETAESLRFDLSSIKAATRNFSAENLLGEGGFGKVYKGKLDNGQEVAVKRLSKNSGQGILEFNTEVVLVAKLQHKNLVKLFGFCLAAKEKMLVYELLPNASLDRFLFDRMKRATLDWETRFKIITGIARGLLYLHEDSRLKIIHRDLKASNILLDEAMNPKISDFGLARLFGVDQTQGDTKRIAGTYGYMAPEYAIAGHFSVKSDVYSFGVIVLEIVSGQRNRIFGRAQHEEALLHRAWRLWNEGVVLQLVDEALDNKYSSEEITKCIHIGLLCIQEDATKRPGMATVVGALNGQSISLPLPTSPHFFATTTEDNSEALEHENIIQGSDIQVHTFTGTENITDFYPR